ncbi:hypothetical protein [Psychroflexus tropicus]|uniref:hypothetical protein n=1 Tax=Psychroflexus tropicus TaxID=197345 RepID=UPI0003712F31|nr:hypothetical protein [Psychroflexus tropicus]
MAKLKVYQKYKSIVMLKQKKFAIPKLNYASLKPNLDRRKYTTKAMITNLKKKGFENTINNILPNGYLDIEQNEIINFLFNSIVENVNLYLQERDDKLLMEIFHSIQLWGGNTGRNIYTMGSFNSNFDLQAYKESVQMVRNGNPEKAINALKKMKQINIAFASKHFSFWSHDLQGKDNDSARQLPILDRLINELVYGIEKQPTYSDYLNYLSDMYKVINKIDSEITVHNLERQLFNFADTDEGEYWKLYRLKNPDKIKVDDYIKA